MPLDAPTETQARIDLAAALRMAERANLHEAVANHFSVALDDTGRRFLLNPKWMHWRRVRASDLVPVDMDGPRPGDVDRTAISIHGQVHIHNPAARVVMHLHPVSVMALASIEPPHMPVINQNTARDHNRVAVDTDYAGMADSDAEGQRLARIMGDKTRLLMGNHGVMIVAPPVAEAWDDIYHFARAADSAVAAMSTGRPLKTLPDAAAEATARDWEDGGAFARVHFDEMKRILDRDCPDYRD